jgi:hypothetical protein
MIGLFLPSPYRRQVKVVFLLLLLLAGLVLQRSCSDSPALPPAYCSVPATSSDVVAIVPASLVLPAPSGRWVRLLDSARLAGSRSHLARKASPRSQWLPAQPAYFSRLHRRPPQSFLDSLARAAALRKI